MRVIVYTTETCPKCKILKTKLQQKNIEYTEINDTNEMIRLGILNVPVLSVDGTMKDFAEANRWVNEQE